MYKKGELVIYGSSGVCIVEDITTMENAITKTSALYYVLRSKITTGGVAYVPVEGNVFMRPIISKSQAEGIVKKIPQISTDEFENISVRDAMRVYRDAINTHDIETAIGLIKHILKIEAKKKAQNKKLSSTEERYLTLAKKIVESELAESLCMTSEQLKTYVLQYV